MGNAVSVQIVNSCYNLLEVDAGLVFGESESKKGYFFYFMICLKSSPFSRYSVISSTLFQVQMISQRCMILRCLTVFRIQISFLTRMMSLKRMFFLSISFTATFSLVGRCMARCTLPKVPCPMFFPEYSNLYREGSCLRLWHRMVVWKVKDQCFLSRWRWRRCDEVIVRF